jgi:hypothetical protein
MGVYVRWWRGETTMGGENGGEMFPLQKVFPLAVGTRLQNEMGGRWTWE